MINLCRNIFIYTDGACSGNPGPGGYAYIILENDIVMKKMSEGFINTTNNRMELLAVVNALKNISKYDNVAIFSDSKYVIDSINKGWVYNWEKQNWINRKNKDLWIDFLQITNDKENIKYIWVAGHSDNKYNNECDSLARKEIKKLINQNKVIQ